MSQCIIDSTLRTEICNPVPGADAFNAESGSDPLQYNTLLGEWRTVQLSSKVKSPTNFLFKNLGSVHYPKGLTNPFGRSLVALDFALKSKDKI